MALSRLDAGIKLSVICGIFSYRLPSQQVGIKMTATVVMKFTASFSETDFIRPQVASLACWGVVLP